MKFVFKNKNLWLKILLTSLGPLLGYLLVYKLEIFVWITFVPIFLLLYICKNNYFGYLKWIAISFFFVSLYSTYFIKSFNFNYFLIFFFVIFFVYIFYFSILFFIFRKVSYPYDILIAPSLWLVIFFFISLVPLLKSWFDFAIFQPMLSPLTWLLGRPGITFLIILFNVLVANFIITKNKKVLLLLLAFCILLSSCFLYSFFAPAPSGKKVRVALIQGNVTTDWLTRIKNSEDILNRYKELTMESQKDNPDLIIWPEYAIPADIMSNEKLTEEISNLAKAADATLIFGSFNHSENTDPEFNNIKNTTYIFSENGQQLGKYTSVLPFQFNGSVVPGNDFPVFDTKVGRLGINTCVEETYSNINKIYVNQGAEYLVNISNDLGLKNTRFMRLKSLHSSFSASENKRYLLRATNSGFTEVINPYGKVIASLEPNKQGILIADIFIKE